MLLKVACVSAGALLLLTSSILYLRFTRDNALGGKSLSWPVSAGRITQSRIVAHQHRTQATDYSDWIEYEYVVRGQAYRGRRVDLAVRDMNDLSVIQALVNSYQPGQEVQVHYDPDNPAEALLVAGPARGTSGPRLLAAKICAPLGLVLIALPFLRRRV
jgi:hypothetical protein